MGPTGDFILDSSGSTLNKHKRGRVTHVYNMKRKRWISKGEKTKRKKHRLQIKTSNLRRWVRVECLNLKLFLFFWFVICWLGLLWLYFLRCKEKEKEERTNLNPPMMLGVGEIFWTVLYIHRRPH